MTEFKKKHQFLRGSKTSGQIDESAINISKLNLNKTKIFGTFILPVDLAIIPTITTGTATIRHPRAAEKDITRAYIPDFAERTR